MIELPKAIKNRYDKGQDLQAVSSGGMWFSIAPQDIQKPYIVYTIISDNPEYTSTDIIGVYLVQFSMFARDIESVLIMFEELEKLFNLATLDTGDEDFICAQRENSIGPTLIDETWQLMADYQIMINKPKIEQLIE